MSTSASAPTLRALALARASELLGQLGPVHCEDPVAEASIAHVIERQAIGRASGAFPAIRGALLASVEHGVHEHPFLLVGARTDEAAPWSLLDIAGLARRPRAGTRFVIASSAAIAVGHFAPDPRVTRLWLRLADGTGDVADRQGDAVLVVAAVGDPATASPARLEYLAAGGGAITSEDIAIAP